MQSANFLLISQANILFNIISFLLNHSLAFLISKDYRFSSICNIQAMLVFHNT